MRSDRHMESMGIDVDTPIRRLGWQRELFNSFERDAPSRTCLWIFLFILYTILFIWIGITFFYVYPSSNQYMTRVNRVLYYQVSVLLNRTEYLVKKLDQLEKNCFNGTNSKYFKSDT